MRLEDWRGPGPLGWLSLVMFKLLLMEEIRLYNQLRLVVYPIIYKALSIYPRWCRNSSINGVSFLWWNRESGTDGMNPGSVSYEPQFCGAQGL